MEELLNLQKKGKCPKEMWAKNNNEADYILVEELYLDNAQCSSIRGLTDDYVNLKKLSLVNNGITSLNGLPSLPHLQWLSLNDNKLTGNLEDILNLCPKVSYVGLAGNRIADISELKPLAKLENLTSLDLYNSPVTQIKSYREQTFALLPKLKTLDGININGDDSDDDAGDEEDSSEEDSGNEVGLDYLTKDIGSESSGDEEDYDPDQDEVSDEDDVASNEDEEEGAGPSTRKRPKLDIDDEIHASDSSNSD